MRAAALEEAAERKERLRHEMPTESAEVYFRLCSLLQSLAGDLDKDPNLQVARCEHYRELGARWRRLAGSPS